LRTNDTGEEIVVFTWRDRLFSANQRKNEAAYFSEGDGIRTRNHRIDRGFLAKAEKAQKPREFPTVYRSLARLQGLSRAPVELRYYSEIPQIEGGPRGNFRAILKRAIRV
jgi:hypothetical protein